MTYVTRIGGLLLHDDLLLVDGRILHQPFSFCWAAPQRHPSPSTASPPSGSSPRRRPSSSAAPSPSTRRRRS
eukprot:12164622-Heterocapsa_arctica.AAC.1